MQLQIRAPLARAKMFNSIGPLRLALEVLSCQCPPVIEADRAARSRWPRARDRCIGTQDRTLKWLTKI